MLIEIQRDWSLQKYIAINKDPTWLLKKNAFVEEKISHSSFLPDPHHSLVSNETRVEEIE